MAIPVLVLINGLFVASEFAIVTSRRQRIRKLAEQGNYRARIVDSALQNQNDYIAATQLGITMASLALGWIGEPAIAQYLEPVFDNLAPGLEAVATHGAAFVIAFALITAMHIILGELAPKSVALWHPERTALVVVPPTHIFLSIFRPFIWLMNASANVALGLFGLRAPVGHHVVTSEDFSMLASESFIAGVIGAEEARILQRTFRFADREAHDVMVPRTDLEGVSKDATLAEAAKVFSETGFTRLPVYEESIDNVVGVLHSKDILLHLMGEKPDAPVQSLMRQVMIVPESKDLAELLDQMRVEHTHVAVVVDEYGVTAGMVTMEDLVEEIVGEITSEHRKEEEMLQWVDDQTVIVDAGISLDDLSEELGVELGDENVNTLGGYVFREMGRVPSVGERFRADEIEFAVLTMERNRVGDVMLRRTEAWPRRRSEQNNGAGGDRG